MFSHHFIYEVWHSETRENLLFATKSLADNEVKNWKASALTRLHDTKCHLIISKRVLYSY